MTPAEELSLRKELDAGVNEIRELEIRRQLSPDNTLTIDITKDANDLEKEEMAMPSRAAQGFNVGLAKGAGAPVDLANFVLSFVGMGSDTPVGGSKNIQAGLSAIGAAPEPGTEREALGKVGRITEEIGAAALPTGAVGFAAKAGKAGGPILKPVFDFFRSKPGVAVSAEAASATGAGVGAVIANEAFPESQMAEMVGQFVGGFVSSPSLIAEFTPQLTAKLKNTSRILFSDEGAKDIAAQIVQRSVRNSVKSTAILEKPNDFVPGGKLTAGQETGDAGLLALERSAAQKSEELKDGVLEMLTQTNMATSVEMDKLRAAGSVDSLRVSLEDKVSYLKNLMAVRANQAMKAASDKLSRLSPNTPREKTNLIVRKEIDAAYDAGRTQEGDLWRAVPKDAKATINGTRDKFAQILKARDRLVDDPEDIPTWLRRLFSGKRGIRGEQKLGRIQSVRSRVLKEMRAERGKEVPNRNKVRILGEIADSLLDDMSVVAGDEVALARAFSKDFNERFTQGTVGDILGFSKTGEPSTASGLTLEGTISRPGTAGGIAADDINRATGVQTSPDDASFSNVEAAARDYIADKFQRKFPDGQVNTTSGRRFLSENREVLSRYPALRSEIEDAIKSQDAADRLIARQAQAEKFIDKKSAASVVLNAPVGKEIKRVLASKNPLGNMRSLISRAKKDPDALKGLKAGVLDEIFEAGKKKGHKDLDLNVVINGDDMAGFLRRNKRAIVESGLFSKDEMSSIERIIRTASSMQRKANSGFPGQQILDESPNAFTDLVLSFVGAQLGGSSPIAKSSGASLQMAGRAAGAARNIGQKWISKIPAGKVTAILSEAVINRELMLELLKRPKTIDAAIEQHKALRAFLFNIVPEAFRDPITIDITEESDGN